jgi:glycosyltransferase involved in cell wall biosynthesis
MTGSDLSREKFDTLKACVIIPTYNNASTLAGVIKAVVAYCNHIIVVNDGSTDNTGAILQEFPDIQLISYEKNKGKGWALRTAFSYASKQGYQYAITIDSDGQHFASDLPAFIEKLQTMPGSLIIGSRNMEQSSVPGKSSFGHKFSNFWFKVETGLRCPDTQSGYRLYPLEPISKMKFFTKKFEFEIEILVRLAWRDTLITAVPVTVHYAPKETRISHFRPTIDFARISILNTILVLIAFLYIKPRNFFRILFNKEKFKEVLKDHLFNTSHSPGLRAASVGFGVFMGIVPIWGFQMLVAIFLAVLFKLNKILVIIAANISVPPMIPLILFLSYKAGAFWMGAHAQQLRFDRTISLHTVQQNLEQYIYGSITLAIVAGGVFAVITFVLLKLFSKKQPLPVKQN